MTTKRTPINRGAKLRVTAEMAELLARLDEINPTRMEHIGGLCPGKNVLEHCEVCLEAIDKARLLDSMLGLKPWQRSPADVDLGDPPDWVAANSRELASWCDAQELRRQIEAASKN